MTCVLYAYLFLKKGNYQELPLLYNIHSCMYVSYECTCTQHMTYIHTYIHTYMLKVPNHPAAMHAKKNNTKGSKIPCLVLQRMPIGRYQLLKRMPTLLFGHGAKIIIYVQHTHHVVYLELLICWKTVHVKLHQLERGQVLSVARDSFQQKLSTKLSTVLYFGQEFCRSLLILRCSVKQILGRAVSRLPSPPSRLPIKIFCDVTYSSTDVQIV